MMIISLISTCLLLVNAAASLGVSAESTLKIISPPPGAMIHAGATLNVTLQVEKVSISGSQQVLLGFGMNSEQAQNPTSLGELFLGLLNTTQTPFDAQGRLSWALSIPAREKMNSTATSFSLVVSQYMFSGPSHTPHCGLVSVPVQVSGHGAPSGTGACAPGTNCASKSPAGAAMPKGPSSPTITNSTMANTTMHSPASQPTKPNMTSTEITAKGHNTGSTIPGTVPKGSPPTQAVPPASPGTKTNSNSSASSPPSSNGNTAAPHKANGTDPNPPPESAAAAPLASSLSLLIALVAVAAGILVAA